MTGWQILEIAIPRGSADTIAELIGVSGDQVRRWRREPLSDEGYTETGRRSPHDRERDLIRAVHSENPEGARLLVEDLVKFYLGLEAKQGRGLAVNTAEEIEATLRQAQHELTRALETLRADRGLRTDTQQSRQAT